MSESQQQSGVVGKRDHKSGPFEIRLNDDGTIDEILLYIDGECVMHLEQMSDEYLWCGLYAEGRTCHFHVGAKRRILHPAYWINASWWKDDDLGDFAEFGEFSSGIAKQQ